jgi:CheY-like chemotaxis protein
MTDLVQWLSGVEETAANFYRGASQRFQADAVLAQFFAEMAEEEDGHRLLLQNAETIRGEKRLKDPAVAIDQMTRRRVEGRLATALEELNRGQLDRSRLLELMVEVEFSEWNDLFLYVMEAMKGGSREFQRTVAEIDRHKRGIERFLANLPDGGKPLAQLQRISPLWQTRILVVEDDPAANRLLHQTLSSLGHVETAANGEEGLEKVKGGYFDVILSDVKMPLMSGIEFYLKALLVEPDIGERFLFFTGIVQGEHQDFFRTTAVSRLNKPASILSIRRAVDDIAHRRRTCH